jgi:hypothetical protein
MSAISIVHNYEYIFITIKVSSYTELSGIYTDPFSYNSKYYIKYIGPNNLYKITCMKYKNSKPDIIKYQSDNKHSRVPCFISPDKYNIPVYWLTTRQNKWNTTTHISYSIKIQLKIRLMLLIENRLEKNHNDDYLWLMQDCWFLVFKILADL